MSAAFITPTKGGPVIGSTEGYYYSNLQPSPIPILNPPPAPNVPFLNPSTPSQPSTVFNHSSSLPSRPASDHGIYILSTNENVSLFQSTGQTADHGYLPLSLSIPPKAIRRSSSESNYSDGNSLPRPHTVGSPAINIKGKLSSNTNGYRVLPKDRGISIFSPGDSIHRFIITIWQIVMALSYIEQEEYFVT